VARLDLGFTCLNVGSWWSGMDEKRQRGGKRRHQFTSADLMLLALIASGLIVASVFILPGYVVSYDVGQSSVLHPAELAKAKNDVRTTLLQGVGGLLLAVGAVATWRQLRLGRDQLRQNHELTLKQLEITERGQITERFTRAIEQLGSDRLHLRIGGIYALERIARDSIDDQAAVAEVLCAFVRTHAAWQGDEHNSMLIQEVDDLPRLHIRAPHVHAAMATLGGNVVRFADVRPLELSEVDLRNSWLPAGLYLVEANLAVAHLEDSHFRSFDLRNANISGAYLKAAWLERANLSGANLAGTDLRGTYLGDALLLGTDFFGANLQGSIIGGADLGGADLRKANLEGTNFGGINDAGTVLEDARLEGALLDGAIADLSTRWPSDFDPLASGVIVNGTATEESESPST
jgi:uncharacterized protein YjbI with pentapeptide repeats